MPHATGTTIAARALGTALLLAASLFAPAALAIDVDAGDYTALPAGTDLGLVYFQHASRDASYTNGSKAPLKAKLDSDVGILRGVHFTELGGYIADPQFLLPFGQLKGKDDLAGLGSAHGLGDLILAATVWLVNQPKSETYFGITPFLYLPTGDYDKNKSLNLGENRWKLVLQAGYITPLSDKLLLDLIGDVTTYGKNNKFGPTSASMKQDSSLQLQAFLRYKLASNWDLRGGVSHANGGETKVDGIAQHDRMRTTKLTIGTAWFADPSLQLIANYGRDASVENGLREADRFNLRLLKVF